MRISAEDLHPCKCLVQYVRRAFKSIVYRETSARIQYPHILRGLSGALCEYIYPRLAGFRRFKLFSSD